MGRKPNLLPSYLLHKPRGKARVRIDGRDHFLGPYGSESSRIRYGELIAQLASGMQIDPIADSARGNPAAADPGPSVGELCLVFLKHAEGHYVKSGKQTSEVHILKSVMRPLNDLYGLLPARDFEPLVMKAVQAKMVGVGWTRGNVNAAISR